MPGGTGGALPEDGVAVLNEDDPLVGPCTPPGPGCYLWPGFANVWADAIVNPGWPEPTLRAFAGACPGPARHVSGNWRPGQPHGNGGFGHRRRLWRACPGTRFRRLLAQGYGTRLVPRAGLGGVTLLDDTYNASPASVLAALGVLAEAPGRRLAVLGDMLELGTYEEQGHRLVGERCAEVVDGLIAVGTRAR